MARQGTINTFRDHDRFQARCSCGWSSPRVDRPGQLSHHVGEHRNDGCTLDGWDPDEPEENDDER